MRVSGRDYTRDGDSDRSLPRPDLRDERHADEAWDERHLSASPSGHPIESADSIWELWRALRRAHIHLAARRRHVAMESDLGSDKHGFPDGSDIRSVERVGEEPR